MHSPIFPSRVTKRKKKSTCLKVQNAWCLRVQNAQVHAQVLNARHNLGPRMLRSLGVLLGVKKTPSRKHLFTPCPTVTLRLTDPEFLVNPNDLPSGLELVFNRDPDALYT